MFGNEWAMAKQVDETVFAAKWSAQIATQGFTCVPNALFKNMERFKLTPSELVLLIILDSYRWSYRNLPFPSIETISKQMGCSKRHVTRLLTSLVKKKLIKRYSRKNQTNIYDIAPLIKWLHTICSNDLSQFQFGQYCQSPNDTTVMMERP